jgi:Restriction Enzyme Adenine Methylase Associated
VDPATTPDPADPDQPSTPAGTDLAAEPATRHNPASGATTTSQAPDQTAPAPVDHTDGVDGSGGADPTAGADGAGRAGGRPVEEAELAAWEGLPADVVFLTSPLGLAPPMRTPPGMWGLTVLTVDLGATGTEPGLGLFAGQWEPEQPAADHADGDVIIRLPPTTAVPPPTTAVPAGTAGSAGDQADAAAAPLPAGADDPDRTTVELLIAYDGQWRPAGRWANTDTGWPAQVAPAAAILMRLHTDLIEATPPVPGSAAPTGHGLRSAHAAVPADTSADPPDGRAGGRPAARGPRVMLLQLLQAGLLQPGEQVYWPRVRKGELHTATITADGCLRLADGTCHPTPSAALTALGRPDSSGWKLWRLTRNRRSLDTFRQRYRASTHPG